VIDIAAFTTHGGALDSARRLFPAAPLPWLDLSTGLNPVAYAFEPVSAEGWARLPSASALRELEAVAAARYGAAPRASVIAASGSQALIQGLPALAGGRDIRILGRSYGEFERVFREADFRVRVAPSLTALAGADVAVVVNPNNPDGRLVPPDDLLALVDRVGTLVVDEAFIDALPPGSSLVPRLPPSRTIVLRSFGKIFGLAGVRLGFAVASSDRSETLRGSLGPWPVSGAAIEIGKQALADEAWLTATRERLRSDGARLGFLLGHVGATTLGATPLFRLVAHPVAPDLFQFLAQRGILTRPFAGERNRLRFGLPGGKREWARLEAALLAFR